jgi:hypothetical protein
MPDEKDLVKAGVEGAVAGAVEASGFRDLVQQFLGPLATEVGTGLGYVGAVLRIKLGLAMMKRASRMLSDAGIDPKRVAPKLFLPILEHASLEEDDYLQERWAALLANAADPSGAVPVSAAFPRILKDLCSEEVRILDKLYERVAQNDWPKSIAHLLPANINFGPRHDLFSWYCLEICGALPTEKQPPSVSSRFSSIFNNLERLKLLVEQVDPRVRTAFDVKGPDQGAFNKSLVDVVTALRYPLIFMTDLGFQFVRACRRPANKQSAVAGKS